MVFTVHKRQQRKIAMLKKKVRESNNPVVSNEKKEIESKSIEETIPSNSIDKNLVQQKQGQEVLKSETTEETPVKQPEKSLTGQRELAPKPIPKRRPPKKNRRLLPKKPEEKEVFSYSNSVKKKEKHLNFTKAQKEALKQFVKDVENMPYPEKISMSNRLFNIGMRALGDGANRFAATSFFKSIILNPKRKESYAFLCVALARMKAYDDVKKVIKKAEENGISLYDLRQNRLFDRMYTKLEQKGLLK
ncbi:hypothetical protein [Thermotomaculum hydrothermale]|uniref:hypothetical protein n=1 Tax=Thermotomaculum hydrothermale TaxID=981385 RepID=UPI001915EB20|nr:hypothetical protein [Thermotomaculum hydrothermale]